MIIKGFRFGMLLQLAVGPICLLIFQTAVNSGFLVAFSGVIGVTLVDGLFIIAAILGIGTLLNNNDSLKKHFSLFGGLIVIIFGLSTVLGTMGIKLIPGLSLNVAQNTSSVMIKVMLLTLANPMTILFWAGIFSAKVIGEKMDKRDLYPFGLGAVLSTLTAMTTVALIGTMASSFLSSQILTILNVIVGLFLVYFGINTLRKRVA